MEKMPEFFKETVEKQYGNKIAEKILNGYCKDRVVSLRVNAIKSDVQTICDELTKNNILFDKVRWSKDALMIKNVNEDKIKELSIYEKGEIYLQSLSSMLPPIILKPKENADILDMTAAPGGKTTQMAALVQNKASITACEKNTIRAERLKYNIDKQGATCVYVMKTDARYIDDFFSFDQILLDAPCSGSGTLNFKNQDLEKTFTTKLIQKSIKAQTSLLEKAIKILKSGNEMVYSTCSILQEENEDRINEILKKSHCEIVPIEFEGMEELPILPTKINGTLCVCPNEYYEGFFVAKIRKIK